MVAVKDYSDRSDKLMTADKILAILINNTPHDMKKNSGIYEIYAEDNTPGAKLSIGVSFEDDEEKPGDTRYIYNIFVNGEYVNINGAWNGQPEDDSIRSIACEITDVWNRMTTRK